MIDSRKTLKIGGKMQILAKISTFEQTNSLQELSCKAVTQSLTLKCSMIVPWFDFRSCFWDPPLSTPMKPKTRQVHIFVELFLQLKMALNEFKLLSITIDKKSHYHYHSHYRSKSHYRSSLVGGDATGEFDTSAKVSQMLERGDCVWKY